jgi:YVTN family beta-propeller protein
VSVIDTATNTTLGSPIAVGAQPWGVAVSPNGSRVYVSNAGSNTVSVINTATNAVIATIAVGGYPVGVAVSPDSTRVYVASYGSNTVSVINASTNTVIGSPIAASAPVGVALNSTGTRLYVTNFNGGTLSVINTATAAMVGSPMAVGPLPYSVAVSPDGSLAYVANSDDTLSVIDTKTNTVVRTLATDSTPESGVHFVAVSPDGLRIYATDTADNALRINTLAAAATVTAGTAGVSTTSIAGGVEAANMSAPAGKIGIMGAVPSNLVKLGGGYYGPNWKTASDGSVGTATAVTSSFGVDMWVTNTRYVEFSAYAVGSPYLQIWVDDQKLTDLPFAPTWNASGPNTIKIDFGEGNTGLHRVRVMAAGTAIGKVWTEASGSVWSPVASGPRLFVLGDSMTQGYIYNTGGELGTWLPRFAELTGIRDYWNGGIGGTGYAVTNGGYTNYQTRASTEAVPSGADIVIVGTPNNDIYTGRTPVQIAADVDAVITTLQSAPNRPRIIILGPVDPSGVNGSTFTDVEAAIISAIGGRAAYISGVGGPLIGFSGETVLASTTPWITTANKAFYIGADSTHPNDAGHAYIAYRMQDAYQLLMAATTVELAA